MKNWKMWMMSICTEPELSYKKIAVIGCGAAGGLVSVLLSKNPECQITAFDTKEPFLTLLPTGGGRCNITNTKEDIHDFVKNYPRGEKFLLSVFSKFDIQKTLELFSQLGVKTYVQDDYRVFPTSNSSKKTIEILQNHLKTNNFELKKEKVFAVKKQDEKFSVNEKYVFDTVIITTGGKGNGFELAKSLGHNVIDIKPSLCSLNAKEKYLYNLAGISFKNVEAKVDNKIVTGDILFAHKFITGPCIFKISALTAFKDFGADNPMQIILKLSDMEKEEIEECILKNSKKNLKNVFSKFVPEKYISEIARVNGINIEKQCAQIKKQEKEILINSILKLELHAINRVQGSEIVSAGGVDLNEVNAKTMESKLVKNLFFAGEILNIDGFTGGYNLQNCWSGARIIASNFN